MLLVAEKVVVLHVMKEKKKGMKKADKMKRRVEDKKRTWEVLDRVCMIQGLKEEWMKMMMILREEEHKLC